MSLRKKNNSGRLKGASEILGLLPSYVDFSAPYGGVRMSCADLSWAL